ncbi:hypothetical protein HG536_0H04620 [Torulaspora globosa]|uniref:Nitrogen permease regulator 2 n=1 Tax=Torulaspora globosa TaxID=48254 RepID=A0A7G3ZNK0_9SACH|nr:uncharacterized protein HG536_0H04620 [Torulaspora globosa]QLL35086.1 hypothetical protein HG536_0H04620 [Torulaspora globosa]
MDGKNQKMGDQFKGFVPIHTIFYAVFHPTEGTKVRFEFPPGNLENHNINFDTIKNYIIPKPQLCHKLLTLKYKNYRIASYPVTVNSAIYARNFFSFNFVFVFQYDCETSPYEPAIARLGKMFKVLEEQNLILSKAEKDPVFYQNSPEGVTQDGKSNSEKGTVKLPKVQNNVRSEYEQVTEGSFSLHDLVLRVYQDLNNYSECLIPIDDGNAVDIKIFPLMTPPQSNVSIEDVPVSTVNLKKVIDLNWDPTMLKIVPFIDGLNCVSKIAKLSNSSPDLVMECVKHLIYYDCVFLADIFQFSNIYAPTSLLRCFLTDLALATECQSHVVCEESSLLPSVPFDRGESLDSEHSDHDFSGLHSINRSLGSLKNSMSSKSAISSHRHKQSVSSASEASLCKSGKHSQGSFSSNNTNSSNILPRYLPTRSCLFDLYRSLSQGVTVKEWYAANCNTIRHNRIDIRRFISFGVMKGLIYRCHSYPVIKKLDIFDLAKNSSLDAGLSSNSSNVKRGKNKNRSNNIFSTSDIRFGAEEDDGTKKHRNALDSEIADQVLKNVYKKLSAVDTSDSKNGIANLMKRLDAQRSSATAPSNSISNLYRLRNSERPSRVSFDKQQEDRKSGKNLTSADEKSKEEEFADHVARRQRDILLLRSIEAADNLDKICVELEMPRSQVEDLLKILGDYKIVNS